MKLPVVVVLFLFCQSFYLSGRSLSVSVLLSSRLNALQCSQVGWFLPPPRAVSLCTFSLVRLSDQKISHSIRLKQSRCADKASAEGASSPCCSICCLRLAPCLSTGDICIFPTIFPHSPVSVCTLPPTLPISGFLSEISELHTYFHPLSSCFLFACDSAIFDKCAVKFCLYLALRVGDISECSLLFICCQCSQLCLFYIQIFKRHKSEIVEPAAMLAPPLCIMGCHFCLSDCSACLGYA